MQVNNQGLTALPNPVLQNIHKREKKTNSLPVVVMPSHVSDSGQSSGDSLKTRVSRVLTISNNLNSGDSESEAQSNTASSKIQQNKDLEDSEEVELADISNSSYSFASRIQNTEDNEISSCPDTDNEKGAQNIDSKNSPEERKVSRSKDRNRIVRNEKLNTSTNTNPSTMTITDKQLNTSMNASPSAITIAYDIESQSQISQQEGTNNPNEQSDGTNNNKVVRFDNVSLENTETSSHDKSIDDVTGKDQEIVDNMTNQIKVTRFNRRCCMITKIVSVCLCGVCSLVGAAAVISIPLVIRYGTGSSGTGG